MRHGALAGRDGERYNRSSRYSVQSGHQFMGGGKMSRRSWLGPERFSRWASACVFLLATSQVLAEDRSPGDTPSSEPGADPSAAPTLPRATSPGSPGETEARPATPYWSVGPSRPFISGRAHPGFGYARFDLAAGYGKPQWMWVGLDSAGILTPMYAAMQAGLHAKLVFVDLTLMLRRAYAFKHTFIPVSDTVRADDLNQPGRPSATSDVVDASLAGFIPFHRWLLTWELTYVCPLGLSSAVLLYEEIQRVVITNQGVVTSKVGPMVKLSSTRDLYVGVLAEHLSLVGRKDGLVIRIGPTLWAKLSKHWDLFGYFTLSVHGPDRLGAWEGMYGAGGFLYRFATGESLGRLP
jgi:hypothetical protein